MPTSCFCFDDPHDGRLMLRRVALRFPGVRALGVPQGSLDGFATECRRGMAARARRLGDVGQSSLEHWDTPLASTEAHLALSCWPQTMPAAGAAGDPHTRPRTR